MERKLVKQGRNALTVTLPAQWLKRHRLIAGDSIFVREGNAQLVLTTTPSAARREITIDVRTCERHMAYHLVLGKYIEGYDAITLLHHNLQLGPELLRQMLGMVMEEHGETRTVFRSIIAVPEENFHAVMRRAVHLLLQQARSVGAVAAGTATREQVKADEKLLDYNLLYCLRYLNKYSSTEHAYRYFLLCATIEAAGDQLSAIAKHIGKQQALAQVIGEGIASYSQLLFSNDLEKLYNALRKFRSSIGTRTFAEGLAFALAETLYNYIGYLVENDIGKRLNRSGE